MISRMVVWVAVVCTVGRALATLADDGSFVDALGYTCADWSTYDCSTAASAYSYSIEGQAALIAACPQACASASAGDFVDEMGWTCADWTGYDCYTATSAYSYSTAGQDALIAACPQECGSQTTNPNPQPPSESSITPTCSRTPSPSPTAGPSHSPTHSLVPSPIPVLHQVDIVFTVDTVLTTTQLSSLASEVARFVGVSVGQVTAVETAEGGISKSLGAQEKQDVPASMGMSSMGTSAAGNGSGCVGGPMTCGSSIFMSAASMGMSSMAASIPDSDDPSVPTPAPVPAPDVNDVGLHVFLAGVSKAESDLGATIDSVPELQVLVDSAGLAGVTVTGHVSTTSGLTSTGASIELPGMSDTDGGGGGGSGASDSADEYAGAGWGLPVAYLGIAAVGVAVVSVVWYRLKKKQPSQVVEMKDVEVSYDRSDIMSASNGGQVHQAETVF